MASIGKMTGYHGRSDLADVLNEFHCQILSANNARMVHRNRTPVLYELDEMSANILASRTRQWLGDRHLSLAAQAEQSILGLF